MSNEIYRLPVGDWLPDQGEHDNPGLLGVLNAIPMPGGGYSPVPYLAEPTFGIATDQAGKTSNLHVTSGSAVPIWHRATHEPSPSVVQPDIVWGFINRGSPPSVTALDNTIRNVTGTSINDNADAVTDWVFGVQMTAYGDFLFAAGDTSVPLQVRDLRTVDVFKPAVTSSAKPTGRWLSTVGARLFYCTERPPRLRERHRWFIRTATQCVGPWFKSYWMAN